MNCNSPCLFSIPSKDKRVIWEVTSYCNMFCQHCCSKASDGNIVDQLFSRYPRLMEQRVDEMIKFGIKEFYLSGGEPLLVKGIVKFIKYLKDRGMKVNLATNGYFLNEKVINNLFRFDIDLIHVSLDGYCAEIHNEMRNGDYFNKITENLKILGEYEIPVRVGCIIWRKNEKYLEEMVKFCLNFKIKELRFSWLIRVGRTKNNIYLFPKQSWAVISKKISKLQKKYLKDIKVSIHRNTTENAICSFACPGGERLFFINNKGEVAPCSWLAKLDSQFTTKTTLKEKEINSLFKSDELLKFKSLLEKRKSRGYNGCPFIAKYKTNSYYKNDNFKSL